MSADPVTVEDSRSHAGAGAPRGFAPQDAIQGAAELAPKPWGFWATLAWGFAAFGVTLLIQYGVVLGWAMRHPQLYIGDVWRNGSLLAAILIISTPIQIAIFVLAARLRRYPAGIYLGLNLPRLRDVMIGIACLAALLALFDALGAAFGENDVTSRGFAEVYRAARAGDPAPFAWLTIAAVLFAPAGEEIMFRGFLLRGWARSRRTVLPAVLATALVWALMHVQYDWLPMLQIFSIGVLFGWLRQRSGSTTLTILLHALTNLGAMVETVLRVEWLG
jgi:uncharacterized protein